MPTLTNTQPELQQVREILERWTAANDGQQHLKAFLLHRLDVLAQPAIYTAETRTLTCPHCEFEGIVDGEPQAGDCGVGFRYLEDIVNHRDVQGVLTDNTLEIESLYETGEGYDDGVLIRLECRNCLGECDIPAGLELNFN